MAMTAAARLDRRLDVDVRPLGEGASLVITPAGRLFEIDIPFQELSRVLRDVEAIPEHPPWPELATLLRSTGALAPAPGAGRPAPPLAVFADAPMLALIRRLPLLSPGDHAEALAARIPEVGDVALVVIRDRLDTALLTAVDDQCAAAGQRWAQLHLDQGRAWMGPAIEPGRTAPYRDVLARRRCAAERLDVIDALLAPAAVAPLRPPPDGQLAWLLTLFFAETRRWLAGEPCALVGNEVEADPRQPAIRLHPVLPLPDRDLAGHAPNDLVCGTDLLLGDRTGMITAVRAIEHDPSIPRALATVQVDVADMGRIRPWATNTVCGGSVFGDPTAARAAAIGEGVERYCGNWVRPDRLRHASYAQLRAAGERAVDPASLVLYSAEQYRQPGFPFVPFTSDLEVHWALGHSLTADRPVWVPASLVYVNWYVGPFAGAPATNFPYYAGLAAGERFEDAVCSGLEEVIERDATMIWWANRQALPLIDPPPRLAALFDGPPAERGQRPWLLWIENPFGVPVLAGVVENVAERLLTIGFAARPDPEEAALKAWAEALTLQELARDLQDPDGLLWQAVRAGQKHPGFLKPWRADRAYLDNFRPDFRDVGDLECQLQANLDPRAVETVRPWVRSSRRCGMQSLPSLPGRSLAAYQQVLEAAGFEVIAVDVTTPDVAASGLRVARAIVPGLAGNFPAAFPFNGRRRLQDAPVALGWRDEPLAEHELNCFPLPHA